jgi:hypothetical protein
LTQGDRLANSALGALTAAGIRLWISTTGRRVARAEARWLDSPLGPATGVIGPAFYGDLAAREQLEIRPDSSAGLLPDFDVLAGPRFDPAAVRPGIRDFYEHTSHYRLDAWSEAAMSTRFFLQLLTSASRGMDQLNFPVSSLELSGGLTNEVLPMVDADGHVIRTGWLRRYVESGRVVYTGLYTVAQPPGAEGPCVKVTFPLPHGSSTMFLRPEVEADGSFNLISSGKRFGDTGFYRMVGAGPDHWRVRYLRTMRESFHVYLDAQGTLRTEHVVRFMGASPLRLHYRMEPLD